MSLPDELRKSAADHRTYLNAGVRSPTADLLDRAADLIDQMWMVCDRVRFLGVNADNMHRAPEDFRRILAKTAEQADAARATASGIPLTETSK